MALITELEPGVTLTTPSRTITAADVDTFAQLTGDRNPLHIDAEWAARSQFGERVAHGMLVLSYAIGLLELDPARIVALRQIKQAKWSAPARLGDSIHVEVKADEGTALKDGIALVPVALAVRNQDDALLCRARVEVLWRTVTATDDTAAEARR